MSNKKFKRNLFLKTASCLMAALMLMTVMLFGTLSVSAEVEQWDGKAATKFSGGGDGRTTYPYKISTAAELKLFANIVTGKDLEGTGFYKDDTASATLTADIDLNLGYTFTFEPDTGLVKLEKTDDGVKGYFGTGVTGDASRDNIIFDETASTKGAFYPSNTSTAPGEVPADLNVWTPITGYNRGTFDGDGYTISGIYINAPASDYIGLFGYIITVAKSDTDITDLTVSNGFICGANYTGGIITGASSDGPLNINNCTNEAIVVGSQYVGGVCGNLSKVSLQYCYNNGIVIGNKDVGGVCGYSGGGTISYCKNTGYVYAGATYAGGICGKLDNGGTIDNCQNTGYVYAETAGGICGYTNTKPLDAKIMNCSNNGTVKGFGTDETDAAGGICGSINGDDALWTTIENCSNSGEVSGINSVGGICGYCYKSRIEYCSNTSKVSGNNNVGGICGYLYLTSYLTHSSNSGEVSGYDNVGGACGIGHCSTSNISLQYFFNTGKVSGNNNVGGVCGYAPAETYTTSGGPISFNRCYNTGAVEAKQEDKAYAGGLLGSNNGAAREITINFTICYNTGKVTTVGTGTNYAGGVVGYINDNNGKTEMSYFRCYYLTGCAANGVGESTSVTITGAAVAKTAEEFASGEVSWLLNEGTPDCIWSVDGVSPIFKDDTHKPIYKISFDGAANTACYTDAEGKFKVPETVHINEETDEIIHDKDTTYTADAAITGVTPTVTDSIKFAYDVTVANDLTPTFEVTFGGETITLNATSSDVGDYLTYIFNFEGILPQQMTENIKATLKIGETEYAKKSEYSVKTYVSNRLPLSESEEEKAFLVNMLCYGAAAQKHLKQTANLATDGLSAELIAQYCTSDDIWNNLTIESVKKVSGTNETNAVVWKSATLVFDKTITMRIYSDVPAQSLAGYYYVTESGKSISEIRTDYIEIAGFTPIDYETAIDVTVRNSSNTAISKTVTYSVESYIASKKNDEKMGDLVRALYDYGVSGKAYKAKIG